jgi:hypothetical protein
MSVEPKRRECEGVKSESVFKTWKEIKEQPLVEFCQRLLASVVLLLVFAGVGVYRACQQFVGIRALAK